MTGSAKQSIVGSAQVLDCFVATLLAMTDTFCRHSGAARSGEPGIHNHHPDYGFRACAKRRIPE
jgi:hypothetical protein